MERNFTSNVGIIVLSILLFGCGANLKERGIDDSSAPITGSKMTPEWKEYNEKAEKEHMPKLVYLATSLKMAGKSPKRLTDHFALTDKTALIFSKWLSVSANSESKINIIDSNLEGTCCRVPFGR